MFTLYYAMVLPGRKSAFRVRAGFWTDCYRGITEAFGRPGADFGVFPVAVRPKSGPEGRFPDRQHYCIRNIEYTVHVRSSSVRML